LKKTIRCAATLLAALVLLHSAAWAAEPSGLAQAAQTAQDALAEMPPPAMPETPAEPDWRLLLVNPWNHLPEDFSVELRRLSNGLQVDQRAYDDLAAMLGDCRAAGLRPLVCSAYRSQATQTRLHNNKITRLLAAGWPRETVSQEAGRWVAVPGTSEHQTGLALDIVSSGYQLLNAKQAKTAEQKWLMEHCWEYGFILRYPEDKTEITGIGYEPWHYRYVGRAAALAIRDSGLCLEEYLEALKGPAEMPPEASAPIQEEPALEIPEEGHQETAQTSSPVETAAARLPSF